jgi:hypothetical protein
MSAVAKLRAKSALVSPCSAPKPEKRASALDAGFLGGVLFDVSGPDDFYPPDHPGHYRCAECRAKCHAAYTPPVVDPDLGFFCSDLCHLKALVGVALSFPCSDDFDRDPWFGAENRTPELVALWARQAAAVGGAA